MENSEKKCPHCKNDDESMIEKIVDYRHKNGIVIKIEYLMCNVCSKIWKDK